MCPDWNTIAVPLTLIANALPIQLSRRHPSEFNIRWFRTFSSLRKPFFFPNGCSKLILGYLGCSPNSSVGITLVHAYNHKLCFLPNAFSAANPDACTSALSMIFSRYALP